MLNMAKVELELIPDPDMYILFEKGTRGRIYYISNRYSKTHEKYLNQTWHLHIIWKCMRGRVSYISNRYVVKPTISI